MISGERHHLWLSRVPSCSIILQRRRTSLRPTLSHVHQINLHGWIAPQVLFNCDTSVWLYSYLRKVVIFDLFFFHDILPRSHENRCQLQTYDTSMRALYLLLALSAALTYSLPWDTWHLLFDVSLSILKSSMIWALSQYRERFLSVRGGHQKWFADDLIFIPGSVWLHK